MKKFIVSAFLTAAVIFTISSCKNEMDENEIDKPDPSVVNPPAPNPNPNPTPNPNPPVPNPNPTPNPNPPVPNPNPPIDPGNNNYGPGIDPEPTPPNPNPTPTPPKPNPNPAPTPNPGGKDNDGSNPKPNPNPTPKPPKPDPKPLPEPEPTPKPPKPDPKPDLSGKRFVHRILIDKATGLKCPACPYMTDAIHRVKKSSIGDQVIPAALFGYYDDTFTTEQSKWWCGYYQVRGFPSAYINKSKRQVPNMTTSTVSRYIKSSSPIGIKIKSEYSSGQFKIDMTFQFNEAYQGLKYTVYILENGIRAHQAGRGVQTHNHVFRCCYANKEIGSVNKGQQVTKNMSIKQAMHSSGTKNPSNFDVVVYVTDSSEKCIQVQKAKANTTKDFDFK